MVRDRRRSPPAVTVTTLSPGADAVIAEAATLRIGVSEATAPALLARLRAARIALSQ